MREYYYVIHFVLNYRKGDSRLAVREFNEKDNYELSNKAATASDGVRGCRVKEIIYTEPDPNKTAMSKSVNMQDNGDYEALNTYTMLQGDENIYAIPDIATKMRGSGMGGREDMYDDCVNCNTVSTPATGTAAMQPRGGKRESGLQLYEDPDKPGPTISLRGKFGLH